jgi:hypothetical protein
MDLRRSHRHLGDAVAAAGVTARPRTWRSHELLVVFVLIATAAVASGGVASAYFRADEMYIVWPVIAAVSVFATFSVVLVVAWHLNPLAEIGFVYLGMAMLYTVMPAAKFLWMHLEIPPGFMGLNFATLEWTPREMGAHFWRQVLLITGVAIGYLVLRGRPALTQGKRYRLGPTDGKALGALLVIVVGCIITITIMTGGVGTYYENYTRLDSLSWAMRRLAYVLFAVRTGSYYVLLVWMFGQYRKYRKWPLVMVIAICTYEIVYSHGSRLVAFSVIMAYIGLYNLQVRSIALRRAAAVLGLLAFGFISIEVVRFLADQSLEEVLEVTISPARTSEFEAVYATGYHLYDERMHGRLSSRPALLGIYEIIAIVPFLDHTTNYPMYWYAREYFPDATVPPATMGIVAMSAIWGGEWNLLAQGLLNGCLYALVIRWFERRREKWWVLCTYVFLYATCVLTLKYSLLYQLVPFVQTLLPAFLVASTVMFWTRSSKSARIPKRMTAYGGERAPRLERR